MMEGERVVGVWLLLGAPSTHHVPSCSRAIQWHVANYMTMGLAILGL